MIFMNNKKKLLLSIIFIVAFFVRFWGIWFDLPYLYTTEEYKTVNYALRMGANKNLNPHFFNYPSLYLYFTLFISGCYFIVGKILGIFSNANDFAYSFLKNPTALYIILRTLSAIWSTGILIILYLIAKKIWSYEAGIFAVLLMIFIPSVIESSHLIQPNLTSVFFVLLSFYFLITFLQTGQKKFFFISSILTGLAISTFYTAIPLILLLPVIYWLNLKKIKPLDRILWTGIFLVILFFIIGTPYSLFDYKTFLNDFIAHTSPQGKSIYQGFLQVLYNFLFIANRGHITSAYGPPFIGIICFLGIILLLKEKKIENYIIILATIVFSIPVVFYHSSGAGYLFPAFPFFILAGARLTETIYKKIRPKFLFNSLFLIILIPSILFCIKLDSSYTLKDTRTVAKEWIEKNIPYGTKILIDMYPHSPPIKETKEQLERLYKRAVELNHYKKEYLKYQLDVHPGGNYGYEIYRILRPPEEVSGTIELVQEAQKVQDLVDLSSGFDYIKKLNIEYIIVNSKDRESGLNSKVMSLRSFYNSVPEKCKLIIKFPQEETKIQKGPEIFIYKVL